MWAHIYLVYSNTILVVSVYNICHNFHATALIGILQFLYWWVYSLIVLENVLSRIHPIINILTEELFQYILKRISRTALGATLNLQYSNEALVIRFWVKATKPKSASPYLFYVILNQKYTNLVFVGLNLKYSDYHNWLYTYFTFQRCSPNQNVTTATSLGRCVMDLQLLNTSL